MLAPFIPHILVVIMGLGALLIGSCAKLVGSLLFTVSAEPLCLDFYSFWNDEADVYFFSNQD